jgi:hypothetical protein
MDRVKEIYIREDLNQFNSGFPEYDISAYSKLLMDRYRRRLVEALQTEFPSAAILFDWGDGFPVIESLDENGRSDTHPEEIGEIICIRDEIFESGEF